MYEPELSELMQEHYFMQLGCYFNGAESYEKGNSRYLWSAVVPDSAWNFATPDSLEPEILEWIASTAASHDRTPAIFWPKAGLIEAALNSRFSVAEEVPERWMTMPLDQAALPAKPFEISSDRIISSAAPGEDFEAVFARLFQDESINRHFRETYIPALTRATAAPGTQCFHLIGYVDSEPAVCASAYVRGRLAGLYNVGTAVPYQRRGFGRWASARVLEEAANAGADIAFLQCEVGTHVEHLYRTMGFGIIATPVIGVLDV